MARPRGRTDWRYPNRSPVSALAQPTCEGLVASVVAAGAILTLTMWWVDTSPAALHGAGPWLTAAGRVTGLLGT